jgi:hypothetical protein
MSRVGERQSGRWALGRGCSHLYSVAVPCMHMPTPQGCGAAIDPESLLYGAHLEGVTSMRLWPGVRGVTGGSFVADTHTAGAITLLLQASLPCFLLGQSSEDVHLDLRGGTNVRCGFVQHRTAVPMSLTHSEWAAVAGAGSAVDRVLPVCARAAAREDGSEKGHHHNECGLSWMVGGARFFHAYMSHTEMPQSE